ncbi:PDR/VanB family oxidoreductase [Melittangium boletus]|uniref:Phthalate 4,5-dioxygenase n=1 Tax=Melittangium boletus DSM 14713 TaxID=1294270 RepID=A0A250IE52_9BACT|nr:PDR/VanB family oxidoreductase [Melittangium boletus]ATB29421.1 phthalate 4,5-dioxygenase [Melittangium boletus DSM 14713]
MSQDSLRLRVQRIAPEAEGILSYELVSPEGGALPAFEAGAHLDVQVPGGLTRQYSLCNDPAETHRYVIAVQKDAGGRGGSRAMHEQVREGDELTVSPPRCSFPLLYARGYVLVAGGIGITPLLSMARALQRQDAPWHLHYCTRSPERTAFRELLTSPAFAHNVTLHHDNGDPAQQLDMKALLTRRSGGHRLYCCGPAPLMRAVREATNHHEWPREKVHFEAFSAEGVGAVGAQADIEFEVVVRSSGASYAVPPGSTVLQVLRQNGLRVPSDCEAGTCGACITRVLDGEPEHRDTFLPEAQRAARCNMMVCVSRARSRQLVLDL